MVADRSGHTGVALRRNARVRYRRALCAARGSVRCPPGALDRVAPRRPHKADRLGPTREQESPRASGFFSDWAPALLSFCYVMVPVVALGTLYLLPYLRGEATDPLGFDTPTICGCQPGTCLRTGRVVVDPRAIPEPERGPSRLPRAGLAHPDGEGSFPRDAPVRVAGDSRHRDRRCSWYSPLRSSVSPVGRSRCTRSWSAARSPLCRPPVAASITSRWIRSSWPPRRWL